VTKVMPDFFRERQERQALIDHYANLRVLDSLHSVTTTPTNSDLSGSLPPVNHCDCIEEWLKELENGVDDENEVNDDLDTSGSMDIQLEADSDQIFWHDNDSDPKSPAKDQDLQLSDLTTEICPTSMDYDEESIHPGEIQYQVELNFVIDYR